MKLRLPLCLLSALFSVWTASAASTLYLADGVDEADLVHSERFYDVGKGYYWYYWWGSSGEAYQGLKSLYNEYRDFSFLGELTPRVSGTSFGKEAFAGLKDDGNTCGYQVAANMIQYWLSYYGPFYTGTEPLAYGYTYSRDCLEQLGGSLSLEVGTLFYDSMQNSGNSLSYAGKWYFCGTKSGGVLKSDAPAGGYFKEYFKEKDIVYLTFKEDSKGYDNYRPGGRESFTHEMLKGFGMEPHSDGTLTQNRPGQLVYLSLSPDAGKVGHAITCYGFELDDSGLISSLKVANSDDQQYKLLTLYVKENSQGYMRLYTNAACTTAWKYSDLAWNISGIEYINTPDRLVDMYNRYTDLSTKLTWTGLVDRWSADAMPPTTDALPGVDTGWTINIGGQAFHTYYSDDRIICFDDSAVATEVHVAHPITRSSTVPSEMHLHNAAKDYVFIGEDGDSLMPRKLVVDGTGTTSFYNLLLSTDSVSYEAYTLNMGAGARLAANKVTVGQHGLLTLSGGSATVRDSIVFAKDAILRVTESSSLTAPLTMQAGSMFDCVLSPAAADKAMLTLTGSLTLGGTVKLEISGDGLIEGTRYRICTVSSGSVDTGNFFTEHGTLSFSDKTLWLTYHEVHSHTWSGGNCRWSATEFGNTAHNTLHTDIVFESGTGTITLSGKVSPHHLMLNGGTYTFSGTGASIDCEGNVDLDGSAKLTLKVPVTAQGFLLKGNSSLTFNAGKNNTLRFLSMEEGTQLSFLGSVVYDVTDAGVMAGSLSVGSGTGLVFRLSHGLLVEGDIDSSSTTSTLRLENSSLSRETITCTADNHLSDFHGTVAVGGSDISRHVRLEVGAPSSVGTYTIAEGSALVFTEGGVLNTTVKGRGTLVLGPWAEFTIPVAEGMPSFDKSLVLEVQGEAELGTKDKLLSWDYARELNLSGKLSLHVAGDTTLNYDRISLDGGTYTYYTTSQAGDVTNKVKELYVGENGGTLSRAFEGSSAYYSYAGSTYIDSITGRGSLTLSGMHHVQTSYYAIKGVGEAGYTGTLHVENIGSYVTDKYHMTALALGAGTYGAAVLSGVPGNAHARAALGITGDVTLSGISSEKDNAAYLYSGSLRPADLDVSQASPVKMITAEKHTLTLNTSTDFNYAGTVLGSLSLMKTGKGTQSFSGDVSAFNGAVTVSGGALSFANSVSVASAWVENKAQLLAGKNLSVLGCLEMNGGALTAAALTTTTASFTGQNSVVQADSISSKGAWTLHVGVDNLNAAVAELTSLSGAGSLTLGGLDIRYATADVASSTYKLLTLSSDFEAQLRSLRVTCNGKSLSIGTAAGTPLYLQKTLAGSYELMLNITDGTAPLPRGEYAVLLWQTPTGTWSLGSGEQSGVWETEHENANFHDGDDVYFSTAAAVSVSGKVAPVNIIVNNESGKVEFTSAKSGSAITGRATLVKEGAGQLTISLANSYTGGTTVKKGTLTVGNATALGTGAVKLEGGTLNMGSYAVKNDVTATGGTLSAAKYAGKLTVAGNVSLGSALSAATLNLKSGTLHGDVSTGAVGILNASGGALDGALTLNGGSLNLTAGTLDVSGLLTLDSVTKLGLTSYTGFGTYTLISAGAISGNVDMLSYSKKDGRRSYDVSISGGDLLLTVTPIAANHTWSAAKGTWTTTTAINGKTYVDGDTVTFNSAAAVTVSGALRPGAVVVDTAAKVTFTSDKKTPGSGFDGSMSLTKSGAGLLTMNAGNTYTGNTTLEAGTLKATAADSFGYGTIEVKGGTLDLGSKTVANDIVLAGAATLKGDAKYTGDVTVKGDATLKAKTSFKGTTTIGEGSVLTLAEKATMAGSLVLDGGSLCITAPKGMTLAKNATMLLNGGSVSGLLTIGTGSTLVWTDGSFDTAAPVLKGGTLDLLGDSSLTLSGSKAQVQFADKVIALPGKGTVRTGDTLTVNSGTVTVSALSGYAGEIAVNGGTLKLSTGKLTTENDITVNGPAAVVNGSTHYGNITVDGLLAKGTNIKLLDEYQKVELNGDGAMLGTISGKGIIDVNADITATAAKLTAATINLNSGTFTNTKGIKLAKGQTLTLAGASLDLGPKGALATVAGSTLVVSTSTDISGNLTLGGGELVFENGALVVSGTLTLSKPMTVTGSGSITCGTLKPFKGDMTAFFGGADVEQDGNTLTFSGGEPAARLAAASLDAAAALAPHDAVPAIPVANPVADAMVQADWGILDAERAFMGAVAGRSQHATSLDRGRGAAWVSAFGASVRHGHQGMHHGSDGTLSGAAFGLEHAVSETGTLGLAVGRSTNRLAATGVTHLRQETAHVALYGQKQLAHGFTADAAATYGDTETKLGAAAWQQKSAALTARLTHARMLSDATAFRTFGGLTYEATDAGSVGAVHTGSVQNLRAEVGAGATHIAGKAHFYAEAALTGDIIRHNPTVDFGGFRTHGANPGRLGLRASVGGIYEFSNTWSGTASYGIEAESRNTAHTFNIGVSRSF